MESLIFDVDGTLWDAVALVAEGWNDGLQSMGFAPHCTEQSIRPLFGKTMTEIAQVVVPGVPQEQGSAAPKGVFARAQRGARFGHGGLGVPGGTALFCHLFFTSLMWVQRYFAFAQGKYPDNSLLKCEVLSFLRKNVCMKPPLRLY